MNTKANEHYSALVADFIRQLEQGALPWRNPVVARSGGLQVRANGEPYQGTNQIACMMAVIKHGFTSNQWLTFNQGKALGARLHAGSKAGAYIYMPQNRVRKNEETGEVESAWTDFKAKAVFNASQWDGLPDMYSTPIEELRDNPACEPFDVYFANVGANITHSDQARMFYSPAGDFIHMPHRNMFENSGRYYSTLAHEHVHWTGAKTRLDRLNHKRFGDPAYAFEELVAELGAAFLVASMGALPVDHQDHASYLGSWVRALKEKPQILRTAASEASKAVDYMNELQDQSQALAA